MGEYIRVCESCGLPFETKSEYRTRCIECPPLRGWGQPPKQNMEEDSGFGTMADIARKQAEEHG
jgi:hypothetical protein